MVAWFIIMPITATQAMTSSSDYTCTETDMRTIQLTVENNTHHQLYVDLGKPSHGDDNGSGWVPTGGTPHSFMGCSDGLFTGYQSYWRLYDRSHGSHYVAEWYVDFSYNYDTGNAYITYLRDNDECSVALWRGPKYYRHSHPIWSDADWSAMGDSQKIKAPSIQIFVKCNG